MPELSDALLDGKVVLVSGGTQGLGAAVAAACVRNGADVVVTGRRKDVGEQFAAELADRYPNVTAIAPRFYTDMDAQYLYGLDLILAAIPQDAA